MIIIPMAGLSNRFKKEGYDLPKYMLKAKGQSLFFHAIKSFERYFKSECFLFIALKITDIREFISQECKKLGLENYMVVLLDQPTRGQAETVYKGIKGASIEDNEDLLIFNIDTFRPNFEYPNEFKLKEVDGYLETFIGTGSNWSNVLPDDKLLQTVKLTAEKQEISEFCCTGLYYWRLCKDFCRVFETYKSKANNDLEAGELYIAPMYNDLIKEQKDIRYSVILSDDVIFCGVPKEYEEFKQK